MRLHRILLSFSVGLLALTAVAQNRTVKGTVTDGTNGEKVYNGMEGMNAVRVRAGLPQVAYSVDALRKERRYEFAFEGIRWGDMRRYGKAYCIAALKGQLGQKIWNNGVETVMKDQGAGYEARYNATYGFRPYPQTEISLSNGVLTQKAGWDSATAQFTSWK